MDEIQGQRFVIDLPPALARRALAIVHEPSGPYRSFSELVVVALENQLGLEDYKETVLPSSEPDARLAHPPKRTEPLPRARSRRSAKGTSQVRRAASTARSVAPDPSLERLLKHPESVAVATESAVQPGREPLSPFTNRLNPLVAGPRVLANLSEEAEPPLTGAFLDAALQAARALGMRLRAEDEVAGRRGRYRRWTAWPVGEDEAKSLARFRKSFLLWAESGRAVGPLVDLGLVAAREGRVFLTDVGQELAQELTPLLDGGDGEVLGRRQREIIASRLLSLPGERREIASFLRAVDETGGMQDQVDKQVAHAHPAWSEAQAVSHRAAMIGRLRDLQVLDVTTNANSATVIVPGPADAKFRDQLRAAEAPK